MKKEVKFRSSSLEERQRFYSKEFSVQKVRRWFLKNKMRIPQLCALDAGTDTGIIKDEKYKGSLFYFRFGELKAKIKKYIPEDIYYDRNLYKNPGKVLKSLKFNNWLEQELVFDIDISNMKCRCKEKICRECIQQAYKSARKMQKHLEKNEFENTLLVYSGRGFHIHVLDKKAFLLSIRQRNGLNKKFSKYPIDPWVSHGYIRLIRMPYSLNGVVSRIVTPVKNSFHKEETLPKFL